MKLQLLIAAFFLAIGMKAWSSPLPSFERKDFLNDVASQALSPITKKIKDLGMTFSTASVSNLNQTVNKITFIADNKSVCGKQNFFGPVSQIIFVIQRNPQELIQTIQYMGCRDNQIELTERIVTRGTNLKTLSSEDILTTKRNWNLDQNEIYKYYTIQDSEGSVFFSLFNSLNSSGSAISQFNFLGQTLLTINEYKINNQNFIEIKKFPVTANATLPILGTIAFNDPSSFDILAETSPLLILFKDIKNNALIDLNAFLDTLKSQFSKLYIQNGVKEILQAYMDEAFPSIEATSTRSKLQEEIEILLSLMTSNPNDLNTQNQIKAKLAQIRDQISQGQILDLRNQ